MTKKEFQQAIKDALVDINDPKGEFNTLVVEAKEGAAEFREHDLVLSQKFLAIALAFEDLATYTRSRAGETR